MIPIAFKDILTGLERLGRSCRIHASTPKPSARECGEIESAADQRRIQAVLMRALDASPPARIAEVTGLSVATIRVIHSRFLREGESWLVNRPGRVGKRRSLLSAE